MLGDTGYECRLIAGVSSGSGTARNNHRGTDYLSYTACTIDLREKSPFIT
jgi:hypothetical protein